jgi:undecaprenyl-diphosphatase
MTSIEALVLGVVQGLTEFIPVSSSGHLIAGHELFGTKDSTLLFDVALHIGTLLALVLFFWKDLWKLALNVGAKNQDGKLARIIAVATAPAAVVGYVAADWIDDVLRAPLTVVITMTVMAIVMLLVEKYIEHKRTIKDVQMTDGVSVGVAQTLALIPGVSRSGATITMGMLRGLKRADAARMSFLMAVPITAGAIAGSLVGAEAGELSGRSTEFVIGIVASLLSGLFAIRLLMEFLGKHSLRAFAYYRLVFATLLAGWLILS